MTNADARRYEKAKLAYLEFINVYPLELDDLEGEIWKNVKGYEGSYQISNFARLKSFKLGKEKVRKPSLHRGGYLSVCLYKDGQYKNCFIHRLVAETFIANSENKHEVNHIDGNKFNNYVGNLEWVTDCENKKHAIENGLMKSAGSNNPCAKLNEEKVITIREMYSSGKFSLKELSKIFEVSDSLIGQIVQYKIWKHIV